MKTILIYSGGMDSTTLLYQLLNDKHEVKCLSFNYGQRHLKELMCASNICNELRVEWKLVDLTSITDLISSSALTGNTPVPHGHYEEESMKKTVVPNRNMIMLSIAIGWAENIGFDTVAIANHKGDHHIYPDCRTDFIKHLSDAARVGTYQNITIISPYCEITKGDIAVLGRLYGIDYDRTWTCYEGGESPCGKCGSCTERIEAIQHARGKE